MSNWDRNYTSYRNQNLYQNAYTNYSNPGRSENYEDWTDFSLTQNNPTLTQQPLPLIPNGGGTSNEGGFVRSEHYPSNVEGSQIFNIDMNSEIWARAANSQLTPTAGEFIPSAMYQSSNSHQMQGPSQSNYSNRFQRNQNSGISMNGEIPSRSNAHSDIVVNPTSSDSSNHPRRNFDKAKNRPTDNRRQINIEQSKAEGRKKLLQEAAGLTSRNSEVAGSSTSSNSVDHPNTKWRSRGNDKTGRANDIKPFTHSIKSQDQYQQPPRRSPPRKSEAGASPRKERYNSNNKGVDEAASQRDRLTDQLNRGKLECLVCCEQVRQADSVWSCHNCYHVLHLRCTIKWANTSKADNGWRCPACQNVTVAIPKDYYCFCDKVVNPDWNRTDTAHSCGEVCNRPKVLASEHYTCVHRCTLLCHPGPCPPCMALVTRKCGCGKTSQTVQCGQIQPLLCSESCEKPLNCGSHQCADKCHVGNCEPCQLILKQECHCGKGKRELQCDGKNNVLERFFCGKPCEGNLSCGHHTCEQLCHEGPCGTCLRDPAHVTHCPCGKTPLSVQQKRTSCLDPIPTCESICEKQLPCGQPSSPHQCKSKCHNGPCPPCDQSTLVRCRCGYMFQDIACTELTTKADDARCQKKCTKKRSCGKHKCNQLCCIDLDHLCPLPCNHMLSCGQHRCDQLCHRGHCQPCLRSSFEELYCECGSSVLLPPIPCGTKPPPCNKPCSRAHDCDHEVLHMCHSFSDCPPCGVLTSRHCHGKHELRKAVPCHMREFSCGLPCSRALPCGRHKCIQPCHNGDCNTTCRQPCAKPRELCGHPCNAPCHDGECIDTPCKESVAVTCECGHRSVSRPCFENNSEYQRIATSLLASKMADVQLGRSVNLADMQGPRKISIKTLECTEECRLIERNRRLAIGLQIRNPDLTAKLTPRYSDFMRGWAKKDQRFCQLVHDKLTELVKLSKESKQKSRSYSFETMNRDKRQFVHEYCTYFGCESVAYDAEPKRNVVATAQRDKAWLPSYSLLEVVQREMGQRKIPLPNLNSTSQKTLSQSNVLPIRVSLNQPSKPQLPSEPIDYFDYNG